MNKDEFRAKRDSKKKLRSHYFLGLFQLHLYRKNGKIVELVFYSFLFRSLNLIWVPNGWILKATEPLYAEGFSTPFYIDRNLIWSCKDLYAYPAPGTRRPKEAE